MHASRDNKIFEMPDNASLSTKYLKWSLDKQRLILWYLNRWSVFDGYDNVFELSDNPTFSLCQLLLSERRHLYYWKGSEERKIQMYLISKAAKKGYEYYQACRGEIVQDIKHNFFDYISYYYERTMEYDKYRHYVDARKPRSVQTSQFYDAWGISPTENNRSLIFIEGQPELAFSLVDADANFLFCDVYDKGDIEEKYFYEQLVNYLNDFNNARENAKAKRDYFVRYDTYDDINKEFALLKLKRRGTRK